VVNDNPIPDLLGSNNGGSVMTFWEAAFLLMVLALAAFSVR
jgi:hypothetical protein